MNPKKTKALEVWEKPTTKKEVQNFSGFVNYYRRFIRNCSKIAKPLTGLMKNILLNSSELAENSYEELREKISAAPLLAQFDPSKKIYVTIDACKYAIGAAMEKTTKMADTQCLLSQEP